MGAAKWVHQISLNLADFTASAGGFTIHGWDFLQQFLKQNLSTLKDSTFKSIVETICMEN